MEFLTTNKDTILHLCFLWNMGEIFRLAIKSSRAISLSLDRKSGLKIEIKSPEKPKCDEPECPSNKK